MKNSFSSGQLNVLVLLRMLIGWHFLYEGVTKLYNPAWTSKGYLLSSEWIFKPLFEILANDSMVGIVDGANIAILILVGASLILGIMVRISSFIGISLLMMYYLAHPALPGLPQGPAEGSYWIVNKNMVEAAALLILGYFPTGDYFSITSFFKKKATPESLTTKI
jgi:thiosulfate dehydrogenase (quinone) large subunit